jgi:hypothetical protein
MDIRVMEAEVARIERETQQVQEAVLSIVIDGRPPTRKELEWIGDKLVELQSASQHVIRTGVAAILG